MAAMKHASVKTGVEHRIAHMAVAKVGVGVEACMNAFFVHERSPPTAAALIVRSSEAYPEGGVSASKIIGICCE